MWVSSRLVSKLVTYTEAAAMTPTLTNRQRRLLYLLCQGLDNQNIARRMELSVKADGWQRTLAGSHI